MKIAEEIHRIIQQMTPTERRYFRATAHSPTFKAPRLTFLYYDFLLSLPHFDAYQFSQWLQETPQAADYVSQNLTYLRRSILKSMRDFHAQAVFTQQLRDHLSEVDWLMGRTLYAEAANHLEKAKKKIAKHGKSSMMLEVLDLESILIKQLPVKKLDSKMEELRQEKLNTLRILNLEQGLNDLYNQVFAFQTEELRARTDARRQRLHEILAHPIMQEYALGTSFHADHLFLQTQWLCANQLSDAVNAHLWISQAVMLWESNTHQCAEQPQKYMRVLTNFLASCFESGDLSLVPAHLKTLRLYASADPDAVIWRSIFHYEMLLHLRQGDFTAGKQLIPEILAWVDRNQDLVPPKWKLPMWFNCMVLNFTLGDWKECLFWGRQVEAISAGNARKEVSRAVRVLQLVAHFECGDDDLVHYLARNAAIHWKQQGPGHRFEKTLTSHLQKLVSQPTGSRDATFAKLDSQLKSLSADRAESSVPGFEEINIWLGRRLNPRA